MIAIAFVATKITPDEEVKQRAALQQMDQLMARLKDGPKYHTLALADRRLLIKDGYAADLVDNLVYVTQRMGDSKSADSDSLVTGFTYAAFDPSLYATESITSNLQQLNRGCCFYCETFLAATDSGIVSHFRPVFYLDAVTVGKPSPYFALAYAQDNLVYSCKACSEQYKATRFAVLGRRYPKVPLEEEENLLINPYVNDPRQYIRFNPLNGQAYAYDRIRDFYRATERLTENETAQRLWQDARNIPDQVDQTNHSLSDPAVNQSYRRWMWNLPANDRNKLGSRGQVTIDTLGLNRAALILSRRAALSQFRLGFSAYAGSDEASEEPNAEAKPDKAVKPIPAEDIISHQYRSLGIDAYNSWHFQKRPPSNQNGAQKNMVSGAEDNALVVSNKPLAPEPEDFPAWFRSSLLYFVTEQDLNVSTKRRLVCLSAKDQIYGGNRPDKCVFLAVNWQHDKSNLIKVRSPRNIWETSFAELSRSRPLELANLFANNEVWVEGAYPALAA